MTDPTDLIFIALCVVAGAVLTWWIIASQED